MLRKHRVFLAFFAATLPSLGLVAHAGVIEQKVVAPVGMDYDTNPLMSASDKESVWRYSFTPQYDVAWVTETSRLYLNALMRFQRSSNTDISINRQDPAITLGWNKTLERSTFGLRANRTQTSTRVTEFNQTGLVSKDGTSRTETLQADWSYMLTERLSLGTGASLVTSRFSNNGDLTNFRNKTINARLSYELSELMTPFLSVAVSKFQSQGGNQSQANNQSDTLSRNYMVGTNFLLSPRFSVNAALGVNNVSNAGSGRIINTGFSFDQDRHHWTGSYGRSVNATGAGGFQNSDHVNLAYGYQLDSLSTIRTTYDLTRNNSVNSIKTQQFGGSYNRQLSDNWDMSLLLQHRNLDNQNTTATGNIASVTLIYQLSQF